MPRTGEWNFSEILIRKEKNVDLVDGTENLLEFGK